MKVLIVKSSSRGDILCALSLLSHLKKLAPNCQIDWVIEKPFCELTQHHEQINHSYIIDTKSWRKEGFKGILKAKKALKEIRKTHYDVLFDLQGNTKSALFTFFAHAKTKVGFKNPREWPNKLVTNVKFDPPFINIRADYVGQIYHYFKKQMPEDIVDDRISFKLEGSEKEKIENLLVAISSSGRRRVLICPQSAWENKKLSTETMKELMQELNKQKESFFFIAWGSPQEKKQAEKLKIENSVVIDRYLLTTLHYLMEKMDLVVAMDSISLHMAAVAGCATLSIFGPTSGAYYSPKGKKHSFFQGSCPYNISFQKQCPKMRTCPTGACMKNIQGKDPIQSVRYAQDSKMSFL